MFVIYGIFKYECLTFITFDDKLILKIIFSPIYAYFNLVYLLCQSHNQLPKLRITVNLKEISTMARSKTEPNPNAGKHIKELLKENNMSQKDFANNVLFVTPQHVSKLIHGKAAVTLATAQQIAKYFPGISIEWLMGTGHFKSAEDHKRAVAISEFLSECEDDNKEWHKFLCDNQIGAKFSVTYGTKIFDLYALKYGYLSFNPFLISGDDYPYYRLLKDGIDVKIPEPEYEHAAEKIADYARLVINDLIATSLEKEEARKSGEAFKESSTNG